MLRMTSYGLTLLPFLRLHVSGVLSLSCFEDNGYTLKPSATNTDPLTADTRRALRDCANQCMEDPCCLSYGMKSGQCETAPFKSNDLDFIKQVHHMSQRTVKS